VKLTKRVAALLASFACGIVFALGLGLSGMTDANVVLAFLNLAGSWDMRLALVMAGALAVYSPVFFFYQRSRKPLLAEKCTVPQSREIDAKLVAGASLFGLGWGVAGICPGPGLIGTTGGHPVFLTFILSMLAGMLVVSLAQRRSSAKTKEKALG